MKRQSNEFYVTEVFHHICDLATTVYASVFVHLILLPVAAAVFGDMEDAEAA